jgi:hypothetical protein
MQEQAALRDQRMKEKCRKYADRYQHAKVSEFILGDNVMFKWNRTSKFQPLFDHFPYKVVSIKASMLTVERDGHRVTRNSRFFKKISENYYNKAIKMANNKRQKAKID